MSNIVYSASFIFILLLVNTVLVFFSWKFIIKLQKPGIATFLGLIKYPIIGLSIYWASLQKWVNPIGVVIGVCAFIISIVVTVILKKHIRINTKNDYKE